MAEPWTENVAKLRMPDLGYFSMPFWLLAMKDGSK